MLRVLLADDDLLVKEVLQEAIPWEELGMEVVGLAEDGQEALDLCLSLRPDILLTDIKMPFYNGLEVAIHLMEQKLPTKVILISGVQDFDYARTALDVQAAGYILKPIQMKEVIATLRKVRDSIEVEQNREQVLYRIQEKLNENLPLAQNRFLCNLILGAIEPEEDIPEKLEYFGLPPALFGDLTVAVAELDDYSCVIRRRTEGEIQLLNFSMKDIVEQTMDNYQAGICVSTKDNELVLLFNREYSNNEKMLMVFESVSELIKELYDTTVSFGVGLRVSDIRSANSSYRGARKAMDYKFYAGNQSVIHINDLSSTSGVEITAGENENKKLADARSHIIRNMRLGDEDEVLAELKTYDALLFDVSHLSQEYLRGQFLELVIQAYRELCETEGEVKELFSEYSSTMQEILLAETAADIKKQTRNFLKAITAYFSTKHNTRHQVLVEQIKSYVEESYMESISLTDVANTVYMSPNYISAVFKRETGQTINEYIIEKKIEAAKELLINTKMKVLEIAERLGYETPHYFSYSFKRYTGKTPQQYRTGIGSQQPS